MKIARTTDVMRRAVKYEKPVWMVPQSTSLATPGEEYCVTYLAITHGANGIVYWEYNDARKSPEIWKTMVDISLEIKELTPALTSSTSGKKVSMSNKNIHAILKELKGVFYLITVNSSPNPVANSKIALPWFNGSSAEVLFENRDVPVQKGAITDSFKGYQRHVYKLTVTSH